MRNVEDALRLWQLEQLQRAIAQGTEDYYRLRSQCEQREDQAWARCMSRHALRRWNE